MSQPATCSWRLEPGSAGLVRPLLLALMLTGCDPYSTGLFVKERKPTAGELLQGEPSLDAIAQGTSELPSHNQEVLRQRPVEEAVTGTLDSPGRGIVKEARLGAAGTPGPRRRGGAAAAGAVGAGRGANEAPAGERQAVSLDFADVSLRELVQVLFEKYLNVPYTILDGFKDKQVNFVYRAQATRAELLAALDAFLSFHGVTLTYSGGVYAITTQAAGKLKGQPAVEALGSVAGVFQLTYLDAKEFLNIARQFMDSPTQALELGGTNAIFVYAPSAQFKAVQMLHERLDVPYFQGKYLIVYVPRHLSPSALKVLIENYEKMLGMGTKKNGRLFEVEAVKELGRVVIVAADRNARNLVVQFLNANDNLTGEERKLFQYVLTNQKAGEVVASVKGLVKSLFNDEGRAEVVADKSSNSLFISAVAEDFAEIVKVLRRLDYRPPAVHIDVTLAEVVLNDSMKYGVEWFLFRDSSGGNSRASGELDLSQGLDKGLILDFVNLNSDKFITLELLASETDFKILANPQMVVKNGATATIVVGSEIAIEKATLETNTAGSSAKTEFERRDVGIRVEATPTIGADQQIQIALRVVDERDIGRDINGQPIFATRELKTELVAYDGDTLFMGGIIRNRSVSEKDKVPLLGDLAFIGKYLFGNQDSTTERTELIMLVTPRLLLDSEGANILTNALVGATLARLDDELAL